MSLHRPRRPRRLDPRHQRFACDPIFDTPHAHLDPRHRALTENQAPRQHRFRDPFVDPPAADADLFLCRQESLINDRYRG